MPDTSQVSGPIPDDGLEVVSATVQLDPGTVGIDANGEVVLTGAAPLSVVLIARRSAESLGGTETAQAEEAGKINYVACGDGANAFQCGKR